MKTDQSKANRQRRNGDILAPDSGDAATPAAEHPVLLAMHDGQVGRRHWRNEPSLRTFRRLAALMEHPSQRT